MGQTFFYDFLCESLVLVQIAFHQSYGLTEYARVAFDDTFDIFRVKDRRFAVRIFFKYGFTIGGCSIPLFTASPAY